MLGRTVNGRKKKVRMKIKKGDRLGIRYPSLRTGHYASLLYDSAIPDIDGPFSEIIVQGYHGTCIS